MRNNLIFTNIHEAVGETHEQTEQKLREFLVEKCKIVQQGVNDIQFERVYRLGQHRNNGPRGISWLNSPYSRTESLFENLERTLNEQATTLTSNFHVILLTGGEG